MNTRKYLITVLSLVCLSLLFQACGKSKLVTSYRDTSITGYTLEKVLVVAVFKDPITQKIYETSFVNLLKKSGVQAYAGSNHKLGTEEPHKDAMKAALQETGATSILITHVLSDTTNTYSVAPMDDYVAYFTYYDSAHGYHSYVYEQAFAPQETVERRDERMSVTLFSDGSNKPIWSAISDSVNLEDRLRVDDEQLEKLFINDLRKKKLIRERI